MTLLRTLFFFLLAVAAVAPAFAAMAQTPCRGDEAVARTAEAAEAFVVTESATTVAGSDDERQEMRVITFTAFGQTFVLELFATLTRTDVS